MRKTITIVAALGLIWAALSIWPFYGLYQLVRAAEAGNAAQIVQRIDISALHRSLSAQLLGTYARLTGAKVERGLMGGIAGAITDPIVAELLTPETLTEILQAGWPKRILVDRPPDVTGLRWNDIGSAWQLYMNADCGVGEIRIALPTQQTPDKQFRLELSLARWRWMLTGIVLPQELQERIVRKVIAAQQAAPPLRR